MWLLNSFLNNAKRVVKEWLDCVHATFVGYLVFGEILIYILGFNEVLDRIVRFYV